MTQQEFEQRTGFVMPASLYREVEEEYYNSELDKDKFCKVWVKQGGIEMYSQRMVAMIYKLTDKLQEEKEKRILEREHAKKELTRVITRVTNGTTIKVRGII